MDRCTGLLNHRTRLSGNRTSDNGIDSLVVLRLVISMSIAVGIYASMSMNMGILLRINIVTFDLLESRWFELLLFNIGVVVSLTELCDTSGDSSMVIVTIPASINSARYFMDAL